MGDYIPTGEGFWIRKDDPSKFYCGIPPEVDKKSIEEWRLNSIAEEDKGSSLRLKAIKLIQDVEFNDFEDKISLLRKLGYSSVRVKGGRVKFEEMSEIDYSNFKSFYEKTIKELRRIGNDPHKKSALVDRLNSIQ